MTEPSPPPSGTGCVECLEAGGWWFHLRRCVECGHVGCCDSSVGQHATKHWRKSGHRLMRSFEPEDDWFWDYATERFVAPMELTPPLSRPIDQPTPGPSGAVPPNWQSLLHEG